MNILITGGAGFIGKRLIEHLGKQNSIFVIDNLSPQVHGLEAEISNIPNVTFIRSDIRSDLVEDLKGKTIDILYHLAAETGTAQSMFELQAYYDVNVMGLVKQLDELKKYCDVKRIVLASSRSVYGEGDYICSEHGQQSSVSRSAADMKLGQFNPRCKLCNSIMEIMPSGVGSSVNPMSQYAITKLTQEMILSNFCHQHNIKFNIFRLQNVYGAGQSVKNPYTGVLATFANLCIADEVLNVYEDGLCSRDFVHVNDVAMVFSDHELLERNAGQTIDLGSGQATPLIEIAKYITSFFGCTNEPAVSGNFRIGDIRSNYTKIPISDYLPSAETDFWNKGLPEFLNFAKNNFDPTNLKLIQVAREKSIVSNVLY